MCFFFILHLPPLPLTLFDFVVFMNSFVLMHGINTQVLRTSGLIGMKMSAVLFVDFFFPDRQYFYIMCQP